MAWPYPEKETDKKDKEADKPAKNKDDSVSSKDVNKEQAKVKKRVKVASGVRVKDPMEGVTLKMALERLEGKYGWDELAARIRINCFASDPSIKSSLKFLRRTPWARAKVEALYLESDWSE